jgi:putative ABC transport system substrate-binding protein
MFPDPPSACGGFAFARRRFITLFLAVMPGISPRAIARASLRSVQVGLLSDRNPDATELLLLGAFREGLREYGWFEGRNLTIVARYSGNDAARLDGLAAELVRAGPDAIFATTLPAALAAMRATRSIPVVFNVLPDPVEQGLVASLARPGGNVTGVAINSSVLIPKRLQFLKEAIPGLARVAVLTDPRRDEACEAAWAALRKPAGEMGIAIEKVVVAADGDYRAAFEAMAGKRVEAVFVPATTQFYNDAFRIASLAQLHRMVFLPSVGDVAEERALLSYGPLQSEAYRRAALYVNRILRGASPQTLPVEQPTRYELVLNLQVAKALGVTFPRAMRARADRLVE